MKASWKEKITKKIKSEEEKSFTRHISNNQSHVIARKKFLIIKVKCVGLDFCLDFWIFGLNQYQLLLA
jgi:hypothetical protein